MYQVSQDNVDRERHIPKFRMDLEHQRQLPDEPQLGGESSMSSYQAISASE